jgi:hypothetical protein
MNAYHETLGEVIEAIERSAIELKAELVGEWRDVFEVGFSVAYEQTRYENFPLVSYKGRPTSKFFHASIYRMPSGRYELTTYIL